MDLLSEPQKYLLKKIRQICSVGKVEPDDNVKEMKNFIQDIFEHDQFENVLSFKEKLASCAIFDLPQLMLKLKLNFDSREKISYQQEILEKFSEDILEKSSEEFSSKDLEKAFLRSQIKTDFMQSSIFMLLMNMYTFLLEDLNLPTFVKETNETLKSIKSANSKEETKSNLTIDSLNNKIEEIKNQFNLHNTQLFSQINKTIDDKVSELKTQIESLNNKFLSQNNTPKVVSQTDNSLNQQFQDLRTQIELLKKQAPIQTSNPTHKQILSQNDNSLNQKVEDLSSQVILLKKQIESLNKKTPIQTGNSISKPTVAQNDKSLNDKVDVLQDQVTTLNRQIFSKDDNSLKKQVEDLKSKIDSLNKQTPIQTGNSISKPTVAQNDNSLNQKIDYLTSEIDSLNQQVLDLRIQIESLNTKTPIQTSNPTHKQILSQNDNSLKQTVDGLTKKVDSLYFQVFSKDANSLNQKVEDLKSQIASLNTKIPNQTVHQSSSNPILLHKQNQSPNAISSTIQELSFNQLTLFKYIGSNMGLSNWIFKYGDGDSASKFENNTLIISGDSTFENSIIFPIMPQTKYKISCFISANNEGAQKSKAGILIKCFDKNMKHISKIPVSKITKPKKILNIIPNTIYVDNCDDWVENKEVCVAFNKDQTIDTTTQILTKPTTISKKLCLPFGKFKGKWKVEFTNCTFDINKIKPGNYVSLQESDMTNFWDNFAISEPIGKFQKYEIIKSRAENDSDIHNFPMSASYFSLSVRGNIDQQKKGIMTFKNFSVEILN